MAKAKLIKSNDLIRTYRSASGMLVILEMNDEWSEIIFKDKNGVQFGEFYFKDLEDGTYKLMRMYSEPNHGGGIGRAALELFRDFTGSDVYTSPFDGIVRDDQSHLTNDAHGFVKSMIKEGLIAGYENDYNNFDDDNGFIDI